MSTDRLSTLAGEISREIPRTHTANPDIQPWDSWLLAAVLALVGFGLVMLYSASAVMSAEQFGAPFLLGRSQAQKVGGGAPALYVALRVGYRWYQSLEYLLLSVTFVMLVLVLLPGSATIQNGPPRKFS